MNSKSRAKTADDFTMETMLVDRENAALQYKRGTMWATAPTRPMSPPGRPKGEYRSAQHEGTSMTAPKPRELFIQGVTLDGKAFRPSDWAERLAGAMACFRPEGSAGGIAAFIGYSPYCVPTTVNGVKCVIVNEALRDIEIMAWDFVMSFARDNQLQVAEACSIPDPPKQKQ
jgi:hypothetical protein